MVQAGSIGAIWIETVAVKETCFFALIVITLIRILGFNIGSFYNNNKGVAIYLDGIPA